MSEIKHKPVVVITDVPRIWSYFQYFIFGLEELEHSGEIKFRLKTDWVHKLSTILPESQFLRRILGALNRRFCPKGYLLKGYVRTGSIKKMFCIDCADAPYLLDSKSLNESDAYFKMQCPITIDIEKGFRLAEGIYIPYCDHKKAGTRPVLTSKDINVTKVKPLMVGFRKLANGNSYRSLKKGYENYKSSSTQIATGKLMCYFGNAQGPEPSKDVKVPDWDWESDIMGYYADKIEHPNIKRARVSKMINAMGSGYDGRVISEGYSDGRSVKHTELIVPIEDFCKFISGFQYNMNISGYRMSIPNRFIESFVVGTAIVTDKLALKWYLPFDDEVIETSEMGYLKNENVDWDQVRDKLSTLPEIDKSTVLRNFEAKWSPLCVARYMVKTVIES